MAPHAPGYLSTESDRILLFVDKARKPLKVRRLDCNICPPTETDFVTQTDLDGVYFMISTQHKSQMLLIVVGPISAEAYRPDSTKAWSIGGSIPGVESKFDPYGLVADDHGHLLVCDRDYDCVRMFNVDDGSYMGLVLSAEQGVEKPFDISRCDNKSMFIIDSYAQNRLYFVKIEIDRVKECVDNVKECADNVKEYA